MIGRVEALEPGKLASQHPGQGVGPASSLAYATSMSTVTKIDIRILTVTLGKIQAAASIKRD